MDLVFDIETDDLKATKIHCIVAQDVDSGETYKFPPDKLQEGYDLLEKADKLIGHNIIGFDIPMVEKFSKVKLRHKPVVDTLVMSRLFNPVREGGHSLEKWGFRLGFKKIEFEDYLNYSKDMLDYCVRDVHLNTVLFKHLKKEGSGFTKDCVALEQNVADIIKTQENTGFQFDLQKAELLLADLREKMQRAEDEVHKEFKPKLVDIRQVIPKLKKDGSLSKSGLTPEEYEERLPTNNIEPFMRRKLQDFNLGSRKQVGEYLMEFGWKPKKFTPTGQPIVDETTLGKIDKIPQAKLIADYFLYQKRIAQVDSWIKAMDDDGRVHGFVIPNGTITGRMSHRSPNMAQVPNIHSPYGVECRACWTVKEGYKLVGIDASGLELRMLAHYMQNEEYINEIINGDIHTANQKAAGLESRDQAKTFIYALIYGAGDAKLGSVVGGNRESGKRLREQFLNNNPSFKTLREKVQRASGKHWLKGIDGRKLLIRTQHAALNTLLQGGGAIVMKRGLAMLDALISLNTFDAKFVANIHDEWQMEVKEDIAENVGRLAVDCIIKAGEYYNLRCPMDGEYKVGDNWSETH
jgi:DNA polymerase I-like protein with 3'-5' exonuclease and polymerase domains